MPTIVVNTAADTIANDGVTSLREAVAQAGGMGGHVDIVFDTNAFYNYSTFAVTAIQLTQTLVIAANITIDGSLAYPGAFYSVKISGAALPSNSITVEAGATATLRDVTIEGSTANLIKGAQGAEGHSGAPGVDGSGVPNGLPVAPPPAQGISGTHGTDAGDAPNDAAKGNDAVGGILNRGTLTLERVDIRNFKVEGGTGGVGGQGGQGGAGGNGENGSASAGPNQSGGNGGNGGDSGDGARGGDGGVGAAALYNSGTLTLRDTVISGVISKGGQGGHGGDGYRGGHGGSYGDSYFDTAAKGGNGGDGGNGGNGGNGGSATALFNGGTLIIEGTQAGVQGASHTAGFGGIAGDLGEFGVRGGAYASSSPNPAQVGLHGLPGVKGSNGSAGASGDFLGANVVTGASFIVDTPREVVSEQGDENGRLVFFNVRLLGGSDSATESVHWEIVAGDGFTNADFELITATSGDLTFEGSTSNKLFGYRVAQDGKAEGLESFTVKLSNPEGGVLGWSKEVTVTITDGDADGQAPTSIKLSDTSLKENSKTNFKLGELSTKDADAGDQFSYALINDAGGRYKIVGNTIRVANATLLDYEQSKTHKIVVRSTDLFGNSIDKKFKISLENVDPEKLKGNAEANTLHGGAGKDTIGGGLGNDLLKGNGDADRFVFDTALDALANVDHIADFKSGLDKIVLDRDIFSKLKGSALTSDAFHTAATAHDKSDRILYEKSSGQLFYDADGIKPGAAPILFAVLDTHPKIGAGDFLIV